MNYASISIDRREAYYERAATLIAADPLAFYTRAEKGRQVQTRRALTLAWSNDAKGSSRAA
jgi:hypothetical protein